jgi:hypothetical protein
MIDYQKIPSQTRYEPRTAIYTDKNIPINQLHAHLNNLYSAVDAICDKHAATDMDLALKIIYGLDEYKSISADSDYNCEYTWQEVNGYPQNLGGEYRTHSIADELPIITWCIASRLLIDAVRLTFDANIQPAISKFSEAMRYFDSHSLLAKRAGFSLYGLQDPTRVPSTQMPPHFARAYMGKAFAFVCRALHQLCNAEMKRVVDKYIFKDVTFHLHFSYVWMDKAASLMESVHTRDSAHPDLQAHFCNIQRTSALRWYEFYLAVSLYYADEKNDAAALDEMNAVIGECTDSGASAYMKAMLYELENTARSVLTTGSLMRNIRYVYNTKLTTRRKIPHKTYQDEPVV